MPTTVPVTPKSLASYKPFAGEEAIQRIRNLAAPFAGAKVLHLNATSFGGGVAEILSSLIPLLRDLGIEADWQVIEADSEFFNVSKSMHNAMQGMDIPWDNTMADIWRQINKSNADCMEGEYDFVVVHDPQPAGLLHYIRARDPNALGAKWIWRCHLDTTASSPEVWNFLREFVEEYDAMIFTMEEYVKGPVIGPDLVIIPPAIDPTSSKNSEIAPEVVREVLERYDIDPSRPIIAQISRFDPWKDPLGVIDVYRMLKITRPELQLIMVASMANDDPEAWLIYEQILRKAGEDLDIHILTNLNGVGNLEVNSFQKAADVLMQKSIREGFGLVVAEGLWKSKAFVGSPAGGIPMQLADGHAGRVAKSTEDFARHINELLDDASKRDALGRKGHEHVRERFLTTRLLEDHLRLMSHLAAPEGIRQNSDSSIPRKPGSKIR